MVGQPPSLPAACSEALHSLQAFSLAVFTTADRDAVKSAIITAATEGVASVTVAGERIEYQSLEALQALLKAIQQDLSGTLNQGGMRITQLVPGGTG